ncbi:hypothetical protein LVJ94_43525 [Pendulispora rubella]|uniref:Uncharacterized protein n=1 Tax=Pendulispora rubella TaxID=2741070 RepID=A0ABZ2L2J7_9BACT
MQTIRPCSPDPCVSYRYPNLTWHNPGTGELSSWLISGNTVFESQPFDSRCGAGNGCSQAWRAVGALGLGGVLWHNVSTGVLSVWKTGQNNHVTESYKLAFGCDATCAEKWKTIGQVDFDQNGTIDLAWHNVDTGEVSIWLLDNQGGVTNTPTLSYRCDSTCSQTWKPLGFIQFPTPPVP